MRDVLRPFAAAACAALALGLTLGAAAPAAPLHSAPLTFPPVDAEPLGHVSPGALVLHDGWQMREQALAGDHGAAFSRPGFGAAGWYATTVPATELGTLARHGVYPDPYVGLNMMHIPDVSDAENARYDLLKFSRLPSHANPWAQPYWFRTEFRAPPTYASRTVRLHLDGVNYRADVWVNGAQVADARDVVGMFRRFEFDVSRLVRPGRLNALAVRVHPLDNPGDPGTLQLGGLSGKYGPDGGDGQILKDVTQYDTVGWGGWGTPVRDRNVGIWQHVWLEATGPVAVRDPAAFTAVALPGGASAAVTVRGYLDNASAAPVSADLLTTITPIGFAGAPVAFHAAVTAPPGRSEFVLRPGDHPALVMKHPRLWWPVTYGPQPLYALSVTARVGGAVSSAARSLMGVRTVGTYVLPSGGRAFTVNGRTVRLTGGAWEPDQLLSWGAQRYRDEADMFANGNLTLLRVNGSGIMPPDCFFDECDRRGVLIWEDFSRTSNNHPTAYADPTILMDNMKDCVARMRGHASLLVWCGANEWVPQRDFAEPMQNEVLPQMDGTRPWLVASSADAPWEKERTRTWSGGPYGLRPLPDYFKKYAAGGQFTSRNEIGLAAPPPINSLARFFPDWDHPDSVQPDSVQPVSGPPSPYPSPVNQAMGFHGATGHDFRELDAAIHQTAGATAGLDDYLWVGDLYSGMAYRAISEAANKARPRNAGTTLWKVNAAWPSFMWQLYDWTLRPNAGYYSMKEACKPLHAQESEDDQGLQVVSTLAAPRPGLRLRLTLADAQGKTEATDTRPVDVPADATVPAGSLPALAADGGLHFLSLDLLGPGGAALDHQVKWVQRDNQWQGLMALPPAGVVARVTGARREAGEVVYDVSVTDASSAPAVDVWLEVLRGAQGREVLPSLWDDNALTLLPGERRSLTVRFRPSLLGGAAPHLMVEGFNVPPREIDVADGRPVALGVRVAGVSVDAAGLLSFHVAATGTVGPRLTSWPLEIKVDGRLERTARVAVRQGADATATVPLGDLPPGRHSVTVGGALGGERPVTFTVPPHPVALWTIQSLKSPTPDPNASAVFTADSDFVVGRSDPAKDWNYLQPGPLDAWAGSKPHTDRITFTLGLVGPGDGGILRLELARTQPLSPPRLDIAVNGLHSSYALPAGAGSADRRPYHLDVPLPAGALKPGVNLITITTQFGSWLVYKAISLSAPTGTTLAPGG